MRADIESKPNITSAVLYKGDKRCIAYMSHVEQELLILPEHLSSPPVLSGVRIARSLVFHVMFCRSLFVALLLAIALSVLQLAASDYHFAIFKSNSTCKLYHLFCNKGGNQTQKQIA